MITSKQRAYLRGLANDIPAIMQVGKEARELVKFTVLENSGETPRAVADALAEALGADVVAVTGKKVVLYRRAKKKPAIELPQ